MFILNDKPLQIDVPFEHEGVQYPANWLRLTSLEEKEAIGITEVSDPATVDFMFFNPDGSDRNLEELQTFFIEEYRRSVNHKLKETDWYVIRKIERSIDIPADVAAARSNLLTMLTDVEVRVTNAKTIKALQTIVNSGPGF